MGLTERHWFEDEEPELTESQLEDAIDELGKAYRKGYDDCKNKECPRWISVSDMLPEEDKDVLVCLLGEMHVASYTKEPPYAGFHISSGFMINPSHWMPLPALPKEDT